jgi:hypothetical protein
VEETPTFAAKLSQKVDMSNLENANSPVPVSPPPVRTWDFMETAFVSLIAYGVYTLTSWLALTIMLAMPDGPKTLSWRSNSTWLTVMVHSAINIFIFFTMGL